MQGEVYPIKRLYLFIKKCISRGKTFEKRNDLIKSMRGLALACMNFSKREEMCLYISYQEAPDLFISIIPET